MAHLRLSDISKRLTNEELDNIFKLKTNSQDSVVNYQVMRVGPAGEGLLSAVYRINVKGEKYDTSFVAKGLLHDLMLRKTLSCEIFFQREVVFFTKILPILMDLQTSLNAKECLQNYIPLCYHSYCYGCNDFLVMEDMSESGYTSLPHAPTDFEKEGTLKVLAHLQAVSMALRIKNPELFYKLANELPECYYIDRRKTWYGKWLQRAIDIDKAVVAEFKNKIGNVYYEKFMQLINDDVYEQLQNISSTWGDNTVLNHGDCWYANFMSSKKGVVALDFQLYRFGSPAIDLTFFIMTCANVSPLADDYKNTLNVYYSYLRYFMEDMNMNIDNVFPRHALDSEMHKYGKFGFLVALTSIPLIISERCDVMQSFGEKFNDHDIIPLEELWVLTPFKTDEEKMRLINALRLSVDVGLI
ncbi:unnamed protein product [Pieris macdunnoughi]|uniref:CHK kinase-like domain-containing protein n=1 Tax=Pieris macdunnoughi TaxID=345717 RepID=A0A821LFD0_9NEOP|nr:unnamed protein product [Pieris macdunnoughi]